MHISTFSKGNSFELLPKFTDKSVDLVLTDPPYDFDMETKMFFHNQFLRISRQWVIVFSPPENQWILPADVENCDPKDMYKYVEMYDPKDIYKYQYLFWEKPISTKNTSRRYSRFVEMIFVYGCGTWNSNRNWSQYTNVFKDLVDDSKLHLHRKPPSLIERLIRNHTNEGDIILDPFCGSGVVAEVSEHLNRVCISIDREGLAGMRE